MKLSMFRDLRDLFLNIREDYTDARAVVLTGRPTSPSDQRQCPRYPYRFEGVRALRR